MTLQQENQLQLYYTLSVPPQQTGFLNRQATAETATYFSEFVAAKTPTEQIMDLRNTLRYLGVPIMTKAYMFGDNKSVVMSSTIPHPFSIKDTICCHITG